VSGSTGRGELGPREPVDGGGKGKGPGGWYLFSVEGLWIVGGTGATGGLSKKLSVGFGL